ncbi:TATA box-binding protein-associated factor RNA polymerase I subunit B [Ipomoea triloba]|uniref:TATA box-binding protein-associated factor RNA polymerase I subunit B n=1 Tax=Ipomoea triloba TaxID=35885 RepID=UPI00125DF007|nr:TATA box-binding protein-associated factor RNA polymerase I subunit B [Ipomoea triloba]
MTERLERLCDVCGNLGFSDGGDGFFYCTRCNSQANDFVDTGVDDADLNAFDGGIYSTTQTRARPRQEAIVAEQISQLKASQSQYQEILKTMDDYNDDTVKNGVGPTEPSDFGSAQETIISPDDYYSEIRKRYVMGVQIMVQLQCKALVEKFNVSPLIVGLTGPIWLRYLAYERVMADEWADEVIHESQSQTQGDVGEWPAAKHKAEPHNLLGKRAIPIWHRSLRSKIPLSCSLAISFLVCHMAREAILPTDIVKWTLEGKLPYFAAFLEIQKQLGPSSRACPISASCMFRPTQAISIQKLESFAASIGRRIGLELPAVNFHAIASRYLRELSLPVEKILPQACHVYEWSMPPELYLSDNESRLPSRVYVMSIVIVTIRIMYDLNGGKWEMMLSRPSAEEDFALHNSDHFDNMLDEEEADFDALRLLQILETKYSEHKDIYDYAQDLASYLQYCKDVVFAGINSSCEDREEESVIEELWDFYQKNKDVEPSDGLKKSKELQGGGSNYGTAEDGANSPGDNKSLHDGQYFNESYKDRAIRQLKSNMEENRFCYIPPSKHTQKRNYGYIRYSRKKDGAYVYAVHADYYILLRSCAQIAQVDVRTMHHGVLTFQKRLEQLDNRIDYCLHRKLPGDFCDFCCG